MRLPPVWLGCLLAATPALAQPFAFVTNQNSNSVTVLNLRDNTFDRVFPIGFAPAGAAVSPDGARLYVVNPNSNTLAMFTPITAARPTPVLVPVGQNPVAVAVAPNNQRVYVANAMNASVTVVNPATLAVVANVRVGFTPMALAVRPDSTRVYVANASSNTVSVINAANNTVEATIPVGVAPTGIAATPDGNYVYTANAGSRSLSQIETQTSSVSGTVELPRTPSAIAIGTDNRAYVTTFGASTFIIVDINRNAVANTIELPPCEFVRCAAFAVGVSADNRFAYVANATSNNVLVIDTDSKELVKSVLVEAGPRGLAISPAPRMGQDPAPGGEKEEDR